MLESLKSFVMRYLNLLVIEVDREFQIGWHLRFHKLLQKSLILVRDERWSKCFRMRVDVNNFRNRLRLQTLKDTMLVLCIEGQKGLFRRLRVCREGDNSWDEG
jgi:hypothetical protein